MGHKSPRFKKVPHLGLTGSLASGKSTTLKFFKKQGWKILSADEIVAEIYKEKGFTKEKLRKDFEGSPAKLKKFEKWIHPQVGNRIKVWMKKQKAPMIVEVPLLFEAKFDRYFDKTVFVYAPKKDREKRVMKRGMSRKLFLFLDAKQMSPADKAVRSDFILHNFSKKSLELQVKQLSKFLTH
ncbi:MAG: dephospho-CoA kinase [Deltaproteobacteria bacterium]|nr:dephospho-CoA kinase [Deltaproteobacteria bacterium]